MAAAERGVHLVSRPGIYLVLSLLGAVLPYAQFIPWLAEHGLNWPLVWQEITASRLSSFAWLDVVVSVLTILAFAIWESRRLRMPFPVWPVLGSLMVGASFGLPLFLYQRERFLNRA